MKQRAVADFAGLYLWNWNINRKEKYFNHITGYTIIIKKIKYRTKKKKITAIALNVTWACWARDHLFT